MAKMFGGEAAGEIIGSTFAAEAAIPGIGEVMMGVEAALLASIMIGKKIKKHHDEKKQRENDAANAEEQHRREVEEEMRAQQEAEEQRQKMEEEAKERAFEAEQAAKKKAEEDERIAADNRKAAQEAAQRAAEQQRAIENQRDLDRVQVRDAAIMDQMEIQRQRRLQGRDVEIFSPYNSSSSPAPLNIIFGVPEVERWRLISGSEIPGLRPYTDQNPPGGGGDDEPGGGGGPNMPSGPGGGGGPGGNNDTFDVPNHRDPNFNINYGSNPYQDLIRELARQIREHINAEKEKPQPQPIDQNTQPDKQPVIPDKMPGQDGGGIRKLDENGNPIQAPLGSNPATWSPYDSEGNLIRQPTPKIPENYNDELHLLENELLAVIAAQGSAELTNEETLTELNRIEKAIPQQAQVNPSAIFSGQIVLF